MSRLIIPSYKSGFARNAAEARYPSLWQGLVGAWMPSLGPTGLTLHDVSGHHNNGTLTNMDPATDWVPTEKGWALDFAVGNTNVACPQNWTLDFAQGISVVLLIRPTNFQFGYRALDVTSGGDSLIMSGGTARNQVKFSVMSGWASKSCESDAGDDIEDGNLHSVVGIVSSGETAIWVDGKKQTDTDAGLSGLGTFSAVPLWLGRPSNVFSGQINEASVYNRALSPNEIQLLYEVPHALTMRRSRYWVVPAAPAAGVVRSKVSSSLAHGRRGLVA